MDAASPTPALTFSLLLCLSLPLSLSVLPLLICLSICLIFGCQSECQLCFCSSISFLPVRLRLSVHPSLFACSSPSLFMSAWMFIFCLSFSPLIHLSACLLLVPLSIGPSAGLFIGRLRVVKAIMSSSFPRYRCHKEPLMV